MEAKTLHLTLKKKWFDIILSGEKKEEYREIKPYWQKRLHECMAGVKGYKSVYGNCQEVLNNKLVNSFPCNNCEMSTEKVFSSITFKNGYQKNAPEFTIECLGIEIGKAKPEWSDNWQGDVFKIKLGNILSSK